MLVEIVEETLSGDFYAQVCFSGKDAPQELLIPGTEFELWSGHVLLSGMVIGVRPLSDDDFQRLRPKVLEYFELNKHLMSEDGIEQTAMLIGVGEIEMGFEYVFREVYESKPSTCALDEDEWAAVAKDLGLFVHSVYLDDTFGPAFIEWLRKPKTSTGLS